MKTDFSIPTRQNLRGIVVVFLMNSIKFFRQNFYVLIPLLSSNVRENYLGTVLVVVGVLIILQLLYSYKSYLNFQFHIQDYRFFLTHGVFNTTDTEIAFDRIQNININQNLIQKVLNVVGVEIETAGQKSAEIEIKALSKDVAIELKEMLLQKQGIKQTCSNEEVSIEQAEALEDSENKVVQKSKILFNLDIVQLFKVGASSNYLKGFGLLILIIATFFQSLQELFNVDVDDEYFKQIPGTFNFLLGFIAFIVIATIIVTIGKTIIKYYDLKVTKLDHEYEVEYGLIKRIIQVIKKNKAQIFEIEENPIKNFFQIKNVFISQASSQEINSKKKIGVIGISDENIKVLFSSIFDLSYPQEFVNFRSSMRLIFRLSIGYLIMNLLMSTALYFMQGWGFALIMFLILSSVFGFVVYKTVRKSHIGVNDDLIEIQSGSIHTNKKYIAVHKVQSISVQRNFFQQRNYHADLIIYTASGKERINYLKLEEVQKVVNYLNFKVESSKLGWI